LSNRELKRISDERVALVTAGGSGMGADAAAYVTGQNFRIDGGLTRSV